jgi:hypothetical protein
MLALAAGALVVFELADVAASTTVPDLRGLPRGGVLARARRLHVRPAFSSRYSDRATGIAIAQNPAAGTRVIDGSTVRVVVSEGPPPVKVPRVVGESSGSAESRLSGARLRYRVALVPAAGSEPAVVLRQTPEPGVTVPSGSTVALSVAEAPQWRALTTFSGVDEGHSVPFRILGSQWRLSYSMNYQETCLLLVFCMGPSADVENVQTGSSVGGFELSEGNASHTFHSGPGLYRVSISGGRDTARWSMTVEDYY